MKNEKGIALSISAIVMIAVGLVVMLVIIGYFVGGVKSTGGKMSTASNFSGDELNMSQKAEEVAGIWTMGLEDVEAEADALLV